MAATYRPTRIEQLQAVHPELRSLVEEWMRQRRPFQEIAREIEERFGVKIAPSSVYRHWERRIRPEQQAEATAFREAHAEAKALLQEMKADPTLDATRIAEIMLANQIIKDRLKLAEVDIMKLYQEQRGA